jgi:hypothetical protein
MKFLKSINKIIIFLFYFSIILFIFYAIYLINSKEPYNKDTRRIVKSIFKKNTIPQHIFNDYRELYLPNTQFIKVNFKKIDLDFLNLNDCYFGKCYTFFLEKYKSNIILTDRFGVFRHATLDDIMKDKELLKIIPTNLDFDTVLDTYIIDDTIYVSGKKIVDKVNAEVHVVKAKINFKNIKFENVIKLKSKKCFFRNSVHSGKIQSYKKEKNKIILSINSSGVLGKQGLDNLSKDSICGKILLVNTDTKKYEVFSSGHRNIIGMYSDENIILATEHGPFAGDEINNIKRGDSYGWPISSYGEDYSRGQSNEAPNFKKSHKKYDYVEPIFSFVPAIGISEIIKLPNNFSEMWQDNFLVGSLNGKHLFRVKFDDDYEKIIYYEKIFIGDRIRDVIYDNKSKNILLSLELTGSLGVLSKAN